MRELITYANAIGFLSLFAASGAIYLALTDNKAAAGTMGGLFLVMAIVSQLDSFKSFKAFTVEAQLQDKIDRADELIKQLIELSILVAKAGYGSTGLSMLALGGLQKSDTALMADFDSLLRRLKLSKSELEDARRPLIKVIGLKINSNLSNTVGALIGLKHTDEVRRSGLQASSVNTNEEIIKRNLTSIDDSDQMRSILLGTLPSGMLPDQRIAAEKHVDSLVKIFEGCLKSGGPTAEFISLDRKTLTTEGAFDTAKAIFEGKLDR